MKTNVLLLTVGTLLCGTACGQEVTTDRPAPKAQPTDQSPTQASTVYSRPSASRFPMRAQRTGGVIADVARGQNLLEPRSDTALSAYSPDKDLAVDPVTHKRRGLVLFSLNF